MNFKKELVKNIFFKGINVCLSFIITVLIVRLLQAEGNGIYSLFIANTAIIALIVGFSFNSGLTYYSAKNQFSNESLLNTIFILLLIQLLLVLAAEKVFEALFGISFYINIQSTKFYWWGCFYVIVILLNGYLTAIFTGNKWFDSLNILTVITNVVFLLVYAALLFQNKTYNTAHTLFILKIYVLLIGFQTLLYLFVLLKKINYRFHYSFIKIKDFRLIAAYAGIAFFSNLFQFFAYRMDYWFINYFRNKEELGLYALASKLNQVLWLLPITVAAVIIPFTVSDSDLLKNKVKVILRLLFSSYILLAIFLAIVSPIMIPLFFGNDFSGTVLPFIILLPGVIVFTLTTVLAAYFAGINRQEINLKISFFCFLIIFIADFLLVPKFGKEGAAAASSLGYAASGFSSLYIFSKQTTSNFAELLFIRKNDLMLIKNWMQNKLNRQ
jgi:O-antigen/teichoic acid export membrane protein